MSGPVRVLTLGAVLVLAGAGCTDPAGTEVKIVWRMTGGLDFTISAAGPDGVTAQPVWGPQLHGDSSWNRPGAKWGTGWVLPEAAAGRSPPRSGQTTGRLTVRIP